MKRIIPVCVSDEFAEPTRLVIGAAGSHNDVQLELTFSPSWRGRTIKATWRDARGENPTVIPFLPAMLEPGFDNVYLLDIPYSAKKIEGMARLTIEGITLEDGQETSATLTTTSQWRVMPSDGACSPEIDPSVADLLQAAVNKNAEDILANTTDILANADAIAGLDERLTETEGVAANKLDAFTIKSDGVPEIVSPASLRSYFYAKRKDTGRCWQFEISPGSNENLISALGGFPAGHTAAEKWFLYIDLPYSEAGGFIIHAQLEGRTNGLLYRQDQWATLDSKWHGTGWLRIEDVQKHLEEHNASPDAHQDMREEIALARVDGLGLSCAAVCHDEAAPPTSTPNTWYVPKTMPKPTAEAGLMVDVFWANGHTGGLGYNVSLVWGEPGGEGNETIISGASVTDSLTGEVSIPVEGTIRYQLINRSDRLVWKYVSGKTIARQYSTSAAADVADKPVHGLELEYLPGMEIYVQIDRGNTAPLMRLVPDSGPSLPVYGNGLGSKTGPLPPGYICHLINSGDHWQALAKPGILNLVDGATDFSAGMTGTYTAELGRYAFSEGEQTTASGEASHTEGWMTKATGRSSHAEGSMTIASEFGAHAEGADTKATAPDSHAEGSHTTASGNFSHAEGSYSKSTGIMSHAEGSSTAKAIGSHSEGRGTIAASESQHVQGSYNIPDEAGKYAHIVGNGRYNGPQSNAHTLSWDGIAWYAGKIKVGGKGQDDPDAKEIDPDAWATVVIKETIPEITDAGSFRTYFYKLRKSARRRYQFEISEGGIHENIVTGVGGRPMDADPKDSAFIYVDLPYSEAGGYIIQVTYQLRSRQGMWTKKIYGTLDANWRDTGWYKPAFIARTVIAPHGSDTKADMTASQIIDAARKGVVQADYTDPGTGELRTYQYFKQMPDGRAVFAVNGYIEDGAPRQTLIYVDYAGNVTTETRTPTVDAELSEASEFPVQNKAVTAGLAKKADKSYVDQTFANAFTKTVSGPVVAVDDVSPVEHQVGCKVESKNIINDALINTGGTGEAHGVVYTYSDGIFSAKGTFNADYATMISMPVALPSGDYAISLSTVSGVEPEDNYHTDFTFVSESAALVRRPRFPPAGETTVDIVKVPNPITRICFAITAPAGTNIDLKFRLQLEIGSTATPFAPYVPDLAAVTVSRCGKNMLNPEAYTDQPGIFIRDGYIRVNQNAEKIPFGILPKNTVVTISASKMDNPDDRLTNFYLRFLYEDGEGTRAYSIEKGNGFAIKSEPGRTLIGLKTINSNIGAIHANYIYDLMVSMAPGDYAPYTGQNYTPAPDGTVSGMTSLSPDMTILTDNPGVTIEATYNRDSNKVVQGLMDRIAALESAKTEI